MRRGGVPPRYVAADIFDPDLDALHPAVLLSNMRDLARHYVKHARSRVGGLPMAGGRRARHIVLLGGDAHLRTTLACHLLRDWAAKTPDVRYVDVRALAATLGDYGALGDVRALVETMRDDGLVVIDHLSGTTRMGQAMRDGLDAVLSARWGTGLPTVYVVDEPERIEAATLRDILADPDTFVAPVGQLSRKAAEPTAVSAAAVNSEPSTATQISRSEPISESHDLDRAILDYIRRNGSPVFTKITANVYAERNAVSHALDGLVERGMVVRSVKTTPNGTYTVYGLTSAIRSVQNVQTEGGGTRTLDELAKITGKGRTTIHRWRGEGLSDEQIIERARA
jgi:hypothetical protein